MTRKKMEKVNRKQVGGTHYEKLTVQPVELYDLYNLDAFQGPILKYLSRHRHKNGLQDLLKAIDYCNLAINYNHIPLFNWCPSDTDNVIIDDYVSQLNKLDKDKLSKKYLGLAIRLLILGEWAKCKENIKLYIYSEYDIDIDKV